MWWSITSWQRFCCRLANCFFSHSYLNKLPCMLAALLCWPIKTPLFKESCRGTFRVENSSRFDILLFLYFSIWVKMPLRYPHEWISKNVFESLPASAATILKFCLSYIGFWRSDRKKRFTFTNGIMWWWCSFSKWKT